MARVLIIEKHGPVLSRLGLDTLERFKRFEAEVIQPGRNRREVLRIRTTDESGRELVLFLKRNWRSYKKDGLASLLRRGEVWSLARQEWENSKAVQRAGLNTAALVAYAEDCGPCWEKFSCLLTEAATGSQNLEHFLRECRAPAERRRIFDAVAREVRRMHEAGLSTPDLYARHIFFDRSAASPVFTFIDLTRLEQRRPLSMSARVRALAALNVSAAVRFVSWRERLRFLRVYWGSANEGLIGQIRKRTQCLQRRKKYPDFLLPSADGASQ